MRRVVITGIGMVTPLALTAEETWQGFLKGKSGTGPLTQIDSTPFNSKVAAEVKNFDPAKYMTPKDIKKTDIFVQFGIASAKMAMSDAKLDIAKENAHRIGILVGSGSAVFA